jgi:hypothetical protein
MKSTEVNPVLTTIRALLKFKNDTTIAEISTTAGISRKIVLDVINRNGNMVWRDRTNGKITRVDPQNILWGKLWADGAYFRIGEENYGCAHTLVFIGNEELKNDLLKNDWAGGLGYCYPIKYVPDTPENRAVMVANGCIFHDDIAPTVDDRLWKE